MRFLAAASAGPLALGLLLTAAVLPAQPQLERILWLQTGTVRDPQLLQRARTLGFTAVSLSSADDAALPAKTGLRFYRDQAIGKGLLELRDPEFEAVRTAYLKGRSATTLVRPSCLSDAATVTAARTRLAGDLVQLLPHRPLAVTLGDEA